MGVNPKKHNPSAWLAWEHPTVYSRLLAPIYALAILFSFQNNHAKPGGYKLVLDTA